MSESFKPWLANPEAGEGVKEALDAQELAFKYKAMEEEMLAFTDRVKKFISYDDVLSSDFYKGLDDTNSFKIALREHAEHGNKEILFDDLNQLIDTDKKAFGRLLFRGIRNGEIEKTRQETSEEKALEQLKTQAENIASGKLADMWYSSGRFLELCRDIKKMSPEEESKITTVKVVGWGEVRPIIQEIETIKDAIEQAKQSKNTAIIEKPSAIAAKYKLSESDVQEQNSWLKEIIETETGHSIELGVEEKYEEYGNIVAKDFLPAYVNYHGEMVRLYDLLKEGKIVETKYIEGLINEALPILTKNPPTIVYFHGDFGSGKTALAVHLCKTRFHQDPIIISGSKFLEPDRLTEEFRLGKLSETELLNKMAAELGSSATFDEKTPLDKILSELIGSKDILRTKLTENIQASRREKGETDILSKDVVDDIEQQIDGAFGNTVQGRYVLGAMYEAMNEGKPLIVDEANAISPDVLIAFNDLLTKKIGEKVQSRGVEGEFTIKKGYCVIWTGNTGKRYENQAGRKDLDPAAYSRIVPIKVEYLPQSREISSMEVSLKRLNLDALNEETLTSSGEMIELAKKIREEAQGDQIFQVLLLKLMNGRQGTELLTKKDDKYATFKDLYRLSVGARLIMDLFEGKTEHMGPGTGNLDTLIGAKTYVEVASKLKKANLSMRELIDNIVGSYTDQDGSMDLEYYLYKFIKKYDANREEQAIIVTLLRKCGFFDTADGWPDYQNAGDLNKMSAELAKKPTDIPEIKKYKKVQINGDYLSMVNTEEGKYVREYFTSLEMMQLLFGYLPPTKKETYNKVQEVFDTKRRESEEAPGLGPLIEKFSEIIKSLTYDWAKKNSTIQDFKNFKVAVMPALDKILDVEFQTKSSFKEFSDQVNIYCDFTLEFLTKSNILSEQDYHAAKNKTVAEKTDIIMNALKM
jgi:MoxR-like ATPase